MNLRMSSCLGVTGSTAHLPGAYRAGRLRRRILRPGSGLDAEVAGLDRPLGEHLAVRWVGGRCDHLPRPAEDRPNGGDQGRHRPNPQPLRAEADGRNFVAHGDLQAPTDGGGLQRPAARVRPDEISSGADLAERNFAIHGHFLFPFGLGPVGGGAGGPARTAAAEDPPSREPAQRRRSRRHFRLLFGAKSILTSSERQGRLQDFPRFSRGGRPPRRPERPLQWARPNICGRGAAQPQALGWCSIGGTGLSNPANPAGAAGGKGGATGDLPRKPEIDAKMPVPFGQGLITIRGIEGGSSFSAVPQGQSGRFLTSVQRIQVSAKVRIF
jgi:hypothetical protein